MFRLTLSVVVKIVPTPGWGRGSVTYRRYRDLPRGEGISVWSHSPEKSIHSESSLNEYSRKRTGLLRRHSWYPICSPIQTLHLVKPRPNDRNMPTQHVATLLGVACWLAFGHRVAMCCNMLGVVGSSLKLVKFKPTTPNMSQHGGQTHATCCAQQCCDLLCWHVAIVWPGLKKTFSYGAADTF